MRRVVCAAVLCALLPVPTFAEQVVLDGKEFRAHLDKDQQVVQERDALRVDRDNLEQQVSLYRQNETNYKSMVTRMKELDSKTSEQVKAQQALLDSYQAREERSVAREQELIDEVKRVKSDKEISTWQERGKGFAAGLMVALSVAVYLARGGR